MTNLLRLHKFVHKLNMNFVHKLLQEIFVVYFLYRTFLQKFVRIGKIVSYTYSSNIKKYCCDNRMKKNTFVSRKYRLVEKIDHSPNISALYYIQPRSANHSKKNYSISALANISEPCTSSRNGAHKTHTRTLNYMQLPKS